MCAETNYLPKAWMDRISFLGLYEVAVNHGGEAMVA